MKEKPPFKFSAQTRVGFSDTDAQGIVYYGRYLPYFDLARVEYHRNLGLLGMDIGVALGGAIFTEYVFQLPGLGRTAIVAINAQDLATVQAVVVFATVTILAFNLLVDLLYAWIDPRIRLA